MYDQLAVICVAFALYYVMVIRSAVLTAAGIFAITQTVMAVGTFPLLDPRIEADVVYGWILTWSMLSYLLVSGVVMLHRGKAAGGPTEVTVWRPRLTTRLLIVVMTLGVLIYFNAVGYSAFIEGLKGVFTGNAVDVATLRLDSYSGDQYFAPGVVNQFKNALLPALVVVVITYWRATGHPRNLWSFLLVVVAAFGLLGTGQRGAFIIFVMVVGTYGYLVNGRRLPSGTWRVGLVAFFVVILATIVLGRGSTGLPGGAPWWERTEVAVAALGDRILVEQQNSAVAGFRYIYEQEVQGGREWAQSLSGVTPWSRGSELSHRIYYTMYGSARGTAPPSVWGSVYHNFGWIGVIGFAPIMGVLLGWVTWRGLAPRRRNTLEAMGIAGVFVTLGMWVSDTPLFLLNTGLVVYVALWWFGARSGSDASETDKMGLDQGPVPHSATLARGAAAET